MLQRILVFRETSYEMLLYLAFATKEPEGFSLAREEFSKVLVSCGYFLYLATLRIFSHVNLMNFDNFLKFGLLRQKLIPCMNVRFIKSFTRLFPAMGLKCISYPWNLKNNQ